MSIQDVVNKIIYLPLDFISPDNDKSIYSLLKETRYFETYSQINEDILLNALTEHPECINAWLSYSENKRTSSGWYFKQNNQEKYIVGYFSSKEDYEKNEYSDIKIACAFFIKQEIESIRKY